MHDYGNSNGGYKNMIWMMIPCFLLLGFLLVGGSTLSSAEYFWPIILGVFILAHIWMMYKEHGGHSKEPENKEGFKSY